MRRAGTKSRIYLYLQGLKLYNVLGTVGASGLGLVIVSPQQAKLFELPKQIQVQNIAYIFGLLPSFFAR